MLARDKLNYGLAIGARNFKCTTIPPEYDKAVAGKRHWQDW
jgi:hypothetical protein